MPTIVPYTYEKKEEKIIHFTSLLKDMKVLVATERSFAVEAANGSKEICEAAGYRVVLLEKNTEKSQLLEAVADVDALIVRSDKVTAEVIEAARNLKIVVRAGAGYDNVDLAAASARGVVVMNTPGHSIGSSCFVTDDFIVTGDTLFAEGYGRTDLYGGNMQTLISSLRALAKLPRNLVIYPGHGDSSTLGDALSKLGL